MFCGVRSESALFTIDQAIYDILGYVDYMNVIN